LSGVEPWLHVVLFQPEIPQNTGNIGRSCVAINAKLWLVRPLGFQLQDRQLKRAGLDYWPHLQWEVVDDWEALERALPGRRFWMFTKFARQSYWEVKYQVGDCLVFGSETSGLPESLHQRYEAQRVGLPMPGAVRSLNLSVAAGIGMYEAFRQNQGAFPTGGSGSTSTG
jgi:tRNA (cytidine/uridine-2'-O-)-methyltransferase